MTTQQEIALRAVQAQIDELSDIASSAQHESNVRLLVERFNRWKARTSNILDTTVSPREAEKFSPRYVVTATMGDPWNGLQRKITWHHTFLQALAEEISLHPEMVLPQLSAPKSDKASAGPINGKTVFIIHGHDELNALKLKELLTNRWNLNCIILRDEAARGRTVIEKFEQEAGKASYAIALFTPDDFIKVNGQEYAQARPNVIFELGWFYGKLGRDHVCILFKEGTAIHSDLQGINLVEFRSSVMEKVLELENELRELISS